MIDSTNPRILADNIRHLSGESGSQASDISFLQTTVTAQGNAITSLGSYSENEVNTGMKFGDADIYRKIVKVEELPTNTVLQVNHGITNIDVVTNAYGIAQIDEGGNGARIIPNPSINFYVNTSTLYITTNNYTFGQTAYFTIEYTKSAAPSPDLSPAPFDTRSIDPEEEVREEDPEAEPNQIEEISEPVAEVKKTTRKKSTN